MEGQEGQKGIEMDRILTPDEWAEAYNSVSVPELPYEGIPVRDLETLKRQDAKTRLLVAQEIANQIRNHLSVPIRYHHLCWASGYVLIVNHWGEEEIYDCPHFNSDFNCGNRKCNSPKIVGDKELTTTEKHVNSELWSILDELKAKYEQEE